MGPGPLNFYPRYLHSEDHESYEYYNMDNRFECCCYVVSVCSVVFLQWKWLIILGLGDLHDMPEHVSNPKGSLMLGMFYQDLLLAEGFNIRDGSVSIKCPKVDPDRRYIVVCKSARYFIIRWLQRLTANSI